MRILLIEDDVMLAQGLVRGISDAGMSVDWVRDGKAGLEAILVGGHGAVLLDLGLPGLDGFKVLEESRKAGLQTPILVLTARDDIASRIKGLDLGADDYVLKPFQLGELLARLRAIMRRLSGHAVSELNNGAMTLNLADHSLNYRGIRDILPAREFALMQALCQRPGTILSRAQIEEQLYGWGEEVESNAVDVLIYAIRKKFGKDVIRNIRGAGWMVAKES
jgi:two-component system, OmpR family, response regulator